ncbi:MAG: methylenetetrahydrofolate--tRNA-(uracil(54)-C(5))-methyltransferase (FADH(2)-oxidizing) TrmFO [Deltaproteobacteria bacterium]|nr:MAG: methylenetetrahydrofolate--tRNA-(uracil(54)-C(5))-methyltransferase (FADH(2)-oxidizing) TrmFO [Deltaproteobacteria bacterium]
MAPIIVIGGGLAGCEAALQAARAGCVVRLYDMKPVKRSPAHQSDLLGELVCSNSFRSNDGTSAVGLLKNEMRTLGGQLMQIADQTAVPAGKALAVDRQLFAEKVTDLVENQPNIEVIHKEVTEIPNSGNQIVILATGPLTSGAMASSIAEITGKKLAFYDAIAPIVHAEGLDLQIIYRKSRWEDGPGDYLNCPMNKEQYLDFIAELGRAKQVPLRNFEEIKYFEGCLPIEVMQARGEDTLRFGPMKPVGLADPRTGEEPYAVVQLRMENRQGTLYNLVGFQTKLTYGEQKRVFRMIPGLEQAEFARYGSIHRNSFICAPQVLLPTLQVKKQKNLFIAGQLSGVEGYVESIAMGLLAGINAARLSRNLPPTVPPRHTALAGLIEHLTGSEPKHFQPSNINFGLFPAWQKKIAKKLRGGQRAKNSAAAMKGWVEELLSNQLRANEGENET